MLLTRVSRGLLTNEGPAESRNDARMQFSRIANFTCKLPDCAANDSELASARHTIRFATNAENKRNCEFCQ